MLWAFYNSTSFQEGCLKAGNINIIQVCTVKIHVVNLGNDADTVGAIYGQLAGAYYSIEGIPLEWRDKISFNSLITLFAKELECMKPHIPQEQQWSPLVDPTTCKLHAHTLYYTISSSLYTLYYIL